MATTFILFELDLTAAAGGVVIRLTNSPYDLRYDGNTYQASGDLLSISSSESTAELVSEGITINLSGVDPAYQSVINANGFLKAPVDIILATCPDNTNLIPAGTGIFYFRGYADTPQTKVDSENGSVIVSLETQSVLGDLDKIPNLLRTTLSSHQTRHAGDLFFEYCADAGTEETWANYDT